MTGTRRNALAADSPTARMLRTIDDRRGTTNPRSIMCLVASAVAAAFAASSGPKPGGTAGKFRGSALLAALKKTARHEGGLHDGLKTLGVQGPFRVLMVPLVLPLLLPRSRSLGSLTQSPNWWPGVHWAWPKGLGSSRQPSGQPPSQTTVLSGMS